MKKTIAFVILIIFLGVPISWSQSSTDNEKDLSKQVVKLKKQVEMLEKRIKSLEKQLDSYDRLHRKILKNVPTLQKVPEGWKAVEYEGLTYYIVPLVHETKKK